MNPHVDLTSAAQRDLAECAAYLGQDNPDVGERFLLAATSTFEDVRSAPATGELFRSSKIALSGLRIWRVRGFPNHLFVYRSTPEGILVRVFHAAQDWQRLLQRGAD
jgi:toxin ParE1/3/4